MDNKSLTHTRWNCTYHIIFIPKYRRKVLYGKNSPGVNRYFQAVMCNEKSDINLRCNLP